MKEWRDKNYPKSGEHKTAIIVIIGREAIKNKKGISELEKKSCP